MPDAGCRFAWEGAIRHNGMEGQRAGGKGWKVGEQAGRTVLLSQAGRPRHYLGTQAGRLRHYVGTQTGRPCH
jgi:hypothetical protein